MKEQAGTIDLTPTWRGVLPLLMASLELGTPEGVALAKAELQRMADAADAYNAKPVITQNVDKPAYIVERLGEREPVPLANMDCVLIAAALVRDVKDRLAQLVADAKEYGGETRLFKDDANAMHSALVSALAALASALAALNNGN